MKLSLYMWLFRTRWVPDFVRVWACRKGGELMLRRLDDPRFGR